MDLALAGRVPPSGVEDATAMRSIESSIFGLLWAHVNK
jgi:hypothetical protein